MLLVQWGEYCGQVFIQYYGLMPTDEGREDNGTGIKNREDLKSDLGVIKGTVAFQVRDAFFGGMRICYFIKRNTKTVLYDSYSMQDFFTCLLIEHCA